MRRGKDVGNRPTDWHVLDLDKDPTPGDPQRVRRLAKVLHDFADDVSDGLRLVKNMAGESTLTAPPRKHRHTCRVTCRVRRNGLPEVVGTVILCGSVAVGQEPV